MLTVEITSIVLGIFILALAIFLKFEIPNKYERFYSKIILFLLGLFLFTYGLILLVSDIEYIRGEHDGAYRQLRNQYEIKYVTDSDHNITDTIIVFDKQ